MSTDESKTMNRRSFVAAVGASALVVGFDTTSRTWVTTAEAATGGSFADVPPLDGTLHLDRATRNADATDLGNIVKVLPSAVLRPGSVQDIVKMVRYCGKHGIKVAARGQAHTTHGHGLVEGLLIENRSLRKIHSIGPDVADVDAGVLWKELVVAAYRKRRVTPPVLTGYLGLSIAGTLSVGGVDGNSGNYRQGLQIDHVRELEVVTGTGEIRRCSMSRNRDLFEAVLGGLGQFGIITRAKVDLVPIASMVRTYRLTYVDNAAFFRDMRTLLNRGEVHGMYNLWLPNGTSLAYVLNVNVPFEPSQPPDDEHLLRGLSIPSAAAVPTDLPYLDFIQFIDNVLIDPQRLLGWDKLIKPWFDVWLTDDSVEQYVAELLPTLGPLDIGPGGFFLLLPQRRSVMTRPFFRAPDKDAGEWVYLLDILTASALPGPDPSFTTRMLERNRRLYEKALDVGGTRYPIGSLDFTKDDWIAHYGPSWEEFARRKRRFDPGNILTPGLGIF